MKTVDYAAVSVTAVTIALTVSGITARLWGAIALHMPF